MAFRMSDFGIPNYDTNVNVLYKNAVEHGESIPCGDEEYIRYRMSGTPLVVVLRFAFEKDGETPKNVIAHTFLENDVRWQSGVAEISGSQARVDRAENTLTAELVNPGAAGQGRQSQGAGKRKCKKLFHGCWILLVRSDRMRQAVFI